MENAARCPTANKTSVSVYRSLLEGTSFPITVQSRNTTPHPSEKLARAFGYNRQLANVDAIFARVLNQEE